MPDRTRALHTAFIGVGLRMPDLRRLGWIELTMDEQDYDSCTELGRLALESMAFEGGRWNQDRRVIAGVLAYIQSETGIALTTSEMIDLRTALEDKSNGLKRTLEWFDRVYPED